MKALERLEQHLKTRLDDISKARGRGQKIIGYPAGGYFPEEIALACNAIPLCFNRAGDSKTLSDAGAYICRWIDPFWRSQIGYLTSGKDPYYNIADIIVVPVTDNHVRAFSNTLGYYTSGIESFVFGVPHVKDRFAISYYLKGITRLKQKLEDFTGVEITKSRLKESVSLCNRERELFREISLMRKSKNVYISAKDFVYLNHGSLLADKKVMVEILQSFIEEVKNGALPPEEAPRILLTGSTLAEGDSKVMDIIQAAGGIVAVEEFAEGIRPYWNNVSLEGDLIANLAESYFMDRVCPGWFRPGTERLNFLIELSRDYKVDGLVWYQLLYRESYKVESYFFPEILRKETGLNMLTLESEYDATENGPLKTRIDTFIDILRR
ncbi:MAG: 2-hydroxyacyl-CoA dehydratase [Dehalococcoidales bacterium]|nr:2-hydroxyacyl-CoA dehydratase [Dehalococcoidales bacterium]